MLHEQPGLQVVGEAPDGVEAVQKAEELQPDLVLLDMGLPRLNGIETARQFRYTSPSSKILFLTENDCPDVARAALATGALGYVVKSDAVGELLPAVESVLLGKQFVSDRFTAHNVASARDM